VTDSVPAGPDPMALLRARTRDRHEALEASPWLAAVTRDLGTYGRHLGRVEALHRDAEAAFVPHRALLARYGFAPQERRKLPALAAEAAALRARGIGVPSGAPADFPRLAQLSAAIGCAYVLEGATLGGLLIARTVRTALRWESTFYAGYGPATAERWRAFGTAVRAVAGAGALDDEALVNAANATFAAFAARIVQPALG
jgi:heme oxygenase (biliverdin-IX-beta and delta-forming)